MALQDKIVLITGGKRGLGRTMAEHLAKEGAIVWVTSRESPTPDRLSKVTAGGIGEVFLDVRDEKSVSDVFKALEEMYGRIDILVNNAGVGIFKPVEETILSEWEEIFQVNMTGLFLCSREAFKWMKHSGGGRIINISSVSGYIPIVENGAYGASKYAVRGFSKICNEEWKEHNVRVTVVSPGAVYTDIWQGREGFNPSDMLQPTDIAETICDIARKPLHVRIDEVKILPSKGVL